MVRRRGMIRGALALLLAAGALLSVSGCSTSRQPVFDDSPDSSETSAIVTSTPPTETPTAAAAMSAYAGQRAASPTSAQGASAAATSADSAETPASGLSADDARALDEELSAIQSELDRLSVPSDSDFDSIGSGLK